MASFVASKVAKHVLKENATNRFGTEDPYFDYVTPHDLNGKAGKVKKTKKAAPPGITTAEAKVLSKVTRRAYRLDNCFTICGIKLGWGAIFGIIPGLGDIFDMLMAFMVYRTCCQVDIPAGVRSKMIVNIVLDFGVGLIPILGDVADALFRANTRNAALLYNHLRDVGAQRIKSGDTGATAATGDVPLDRVARASRSRSHSRGRAGAQQQQQQIMGKSSASNKQQAITSPTSQQQQQQHSALTSPVDNRHHNGQEPSAHHNVAPPEYTKTKNGNKGGWLDRFTGASASGGGGGAAAAATAGGVAGGGSTKKKTAEPDLEAGEGRF